MLKVGRIILIAFFLTSIVSFSFGQEVKATPASQLFDAAQLLRDIQTLSADEMEGRSPARPSMVKTRDYIEKRFKESGVDAKRQEFEIKLRDSKEMLKGINFIGQIKGRKNPDKYIVVTAHYDHDGVKKGEIYNGADDNASGAAALFAIASYFTKNPPEHSIILVAFDAEEMGLLGAKHFVANLPVKKKLVIVNVNMDMISRSDKGELWAGGAYHYPQLKPLLERAQKKASVKLLLGHDDPKLGAYDDWTLQSDHAVFHLEKIPFIYFGVDNHKDYHTPNDDFANIDPTFYVKAVETIIETLKIIDGK